MGGLFRSPPKPDTSAQEEQIALQRQAQETQNAALARQEAQTKQAEQRAAATRRARGTSGRAQLLTMGEAGVLAPMDTSGLATKLGA